ncbi:hypothetical protein HYH82_09755 [Clostridium botulinum]|uniref:hypothetical protein n=1 Tax=Clostridium botulinum TaxID=1491 RepID=UPI0012B6A496|nr:hypothetical protein [Clostridium botulinum]MBY6757590.1 hypothetical protein [Clostridium botulinum]WGZ47365.1 hypothetical protein HEQ52_14355 [Clostridium botulinum]HDI3025203.1 hypothetical protein [Clostridium botulinum]HDI3028381.1 hypothetical protein [Clostridium botulinum]HDI3036623.1 hypothetical protein [Clostridium botulinum]
MPFGSSIKKNLDDGNGEIGPLLIGIFLIFKSSIASSSDLTLKPIESPSLRVQTF